MIAGGDNSSPELLDVPKKFEYQVISQDGRIATVVYRSLPPGPNDLAAEVDLNFYGGTIEPYHYLKACGEMQSAGASLRVVVAHTGDSIQTFPTTRVLLVRHGEVESGSPNPNLSPAGQSRAGVLANIAFEADVQAVFATDFCRTVQTGQPTAAQLNVDLRIQSIGQGETALTNCTPAISVPYQLLPQNLTSLDNFGAYLLSDAVPDSILVVSHSNIVPALVSTLAADWPCPDDWMSMNSSCHIPSGEFNHLIRLSVASQASFVYVDHQTY